MYVPPKSVDHPAMPTSSIVEQISPISPPIQHNIPPLSTVKKTPRLSPPWNHTASPLQLHVPPYPGPVEPPYSHAPTSNTTPTTKYNAYPIIATAEKMCNTTPLHPHTKISLAAREDFILIIPFKIKTLFKEDDYDY